MSDQQRLRCSFNPAGTTLLVVGVEGRFRLFDTNTGRLQVEFASKAEGSESAQPCTCFAWAAVKQESTNGSGPVKQLVIVGNDTGEVAAFDTALGEELWRTPGCHEGGVSGVAWAGAGNDQTLFSVGADAVACSINALTGQVQQRLEAGKHALTCVKSASDGQRLLLGSSGLALWDAATQQRLYKYAGHAMPADALDFSPDGQHALSSGQSERHVAVWKASGKASKKSKAPAALLSMEQPPAQLDTAPASQPAAKDSFTVVAVSTSGRLCVWLCEVGDGVKATLRATIQIEQDSAMSSSAQQERIHAARLETTGAEEQVVVARGSLAKPTIQRITLPAGAAPAVINLPQQQADSVLLRSKQKGKQAAQAVTHPPTPPEAVGADNAGHPVMLKSHSGKRQAEQEEEAALDTQGAAEEQTLAEVRGQEGQEGQEEQEDGELTLEQRVNALQLQQRPASAPEAIEAGSPAGKATSVVVLLSQALRSDDHQLLEKCFAMSNDKVIRSTVQQLAPQDAARLLTVAVQRLQSSPKRGKQIAAWVRALLLFHTAYLISAPGVQGSLTGLYQAIEARLALYKPLVSLQGRLDLVLAQTAPVDPLASHLAAGPLIHHDEGEELQEVEAEDMLALQGAPELQSDLEESDDSELDSASDMSDDESEGE